MLLSRTNLHVISAAGAGPRNCLFLDADGTTLAADKFSFLIAEPCPLNEAAYGTPNVLGAFPPSDGIALNSDLVSRSLRSLPRTPKKPIHKVAVLTRCDHYTELTASDGINVHRESSPPARVQMPDYRNAIKSLSSARSRVCVNLKQLRALLSTIEKCCGGDEKQPLFIEIGSEQEPLLLRTNAYKTKQRLIGVAMPMKALRWLEKNEWERKLVSEGKKGRMKK